MPTGVMNVGLGSVKSVEQSIFSQTRKAVKAVDRERDTLFYRQRCRELKQQLAAANKEIERLCAICQRESKVLCEALKRKNNKSMIKVVAGTLAEQAEQEGG